MNPEIRVGITTGWDRGTTVRHWPLVYTPKAIVDAVVQAGGLPVLLPIAERPETRDSLLNHVDAIILAGEVLSISTDLLREVASKDLESQNPLRFACERDYLLGALRRDLPTLGICRGHQIMTSVMGGVLYLEDIHGRPESRGVLHQQGERPPQEVVHEVAVSGFLQDLLGRDRIWVNSFHRQGVLEPPPGFSVVARSEDGWVEGMISRDHSFVLGLQFHPETLDDPGWAKLFRHFVQRGREYRRRNGV